MVRAVKLSLMKTLREKLIDLEEMTTLLVEVEEIVN